MYFICKRYNNARNLHSNRNSNYGFAVMAKHHITCQTDDQWSHIPLLALLGWQALHACAFSVAWLQEAHVQLQHHSQDCGQIGEQYTQTGIRVLVANQISFINVFKIQHTCVLQMLAAFTLFISCSTTVVSTLSQCDWLKALFFMIVALFYCLVPVWWWLSVVW